MQTVIRSFSRASFAIGGALFFVGLHRFIFGIHPKLIADRDPP